MYQSVSVVVPVYDGANELRQCLDCLRQSSVPVEECIVVDDGSTDGSSAVAEAFGVTVLSTGARLGPAHARNLGVAAATGDIILFIDADVCVQPDTIGRILREFALDPTIDAVIGSYDRNPSGSGYLSKFRNLMHHFVHQNANREASTFWAGCGAVRRLVFLDAGGFNTDYRSASIEDIELGYRLAKAGHRLVFVPEVQATHLKDWGLRKMLQTDFYYRALPWSELSLRTGSMPDDLNLRISQRISVALVAILFALAAWLSLAHTHFLMPLFVTVFALLSEYWTESAEQESRWPLAAMGLVLALIVGLSWWSGAYVVIPAVLMAAVALFTRHRYAERHQGWTRVGRILLGLYLTGIVAAAWLLAPFHPLECALAVAVLLLLALNKQFYMFLVADRGTFFAIAAIPFHLLYFASAGLAFSIAAMFHGGRMVRGAVRKAAA